MRKKIIILFIILLGVGVFGYLGYKNYQIKHPIINISLKDERDVLFLSDVHVMDFITNINGSVIDNYKIDTTKVGKKKVKFSYINEDKIKVNYSYDINIIDNVAPVVWLGNSYSVTKGSKINLLSKIMCGDNYDNNPTCEIIGDYDMNKVGVYPLTFKATDNSKNVTEKKFNLYVNEPKPKTNNGVSSVKTYFADVINNYKSSDTEIGLDISEWQGDVDFNKLKEAGVEFVFLRVGGTKGIKGDYFLDAKFIQNITRANEAQIPVGVYFYSYANSREKALKDAKWIYEQIKPYKVELGVAFDWENWSFYNEFNLSFFGLTDMANGFLDYFKDKGYNGFLYSSKNYLEQIWLPTNYPIWLAHYAKSTSFKGNYHYWQICNNGRVDGINADVDIDIRYKNK